MNAIGDLFQNQVVQFDGILKAGRYSNQVRNMGFNDK